MKMLQPVFSSFLRSFNKIPQAPTVPDTQERVHLVEFKVSVGARCYDANNHTEDNSFIIMTVARENMNRVMKALENPR